MNLSESITQKVQTLPSDKQQEVLDFIEFLIHKATDETEAIAQSEQSIELHHPQTPLGIKLNEIRQRAIASGMELASAEEIASKLSDERERCSNCNT